MEKSGDCWSMFEYIFSSNYTYLFEFCSKPSYYNMQIFYFEEQY